MWRAYHRLHSSSSIVIPSTVKGRANLTRTTRKLVVWAVAIIALVVLIVAVLLTGLRRQAVERAKRERLREINVEIKGILRDRATLDLDGLQRSEMQEEVIWLSRERRELQDELNESALLFRFQSLFADNSRAKRSKP